MEKRLSRMIADKFGVLRTKLGGESRERFDVLENLKICLENDFPKLSQEIKTEIKSREQGDSAVMTKIKDEIGKVQELLTTEKKTRVDTEEAVVEVLREMVNKVKKDLEQEKTNRTQNEEALLSLLESTISKLNKSNAHQF
jgi:CRISPR/Cas system CSM-associated protein Csm2 small subunit